MQDILSAVAVGLLLTTADGETIVHADRTVTFRISAPSANHVEVVPYGVQYRMRNGLGNQEFPLRKGADGKWTVTTPPAEPGFHYYFVRIDGVETFVSGERPYFGWGKNTNGVEIPETGSLLGLVRHVPHGKMQLVDYPSSVTKAERRIMVYTPPGYDKSSSRFPVLYLQHGRGESELAWPNQGRLAEIMDGLIADKKAKPMIVVMEDGEAFAPEDTGRNNDRLPRILAEDTIPLVDQKFRTIRGRDSRAIAGLSMGAWQAFSTAFTYPKLIGSVGAMSGGAPDDLDHSYSGALGNAKLLKSFRLVFLSTGKEDDIRGPMQRVAAKMRLTGIQPAWFESAGGHEWLPWRKALADLAPQLFR